MRVFSSEGSTPGHGGAAIGRWRLSAPWAEGGWADVADDRAEDRDASRRDGL